MPADTVVVRVDPPYPVTVGEDVFQNVTAALEPRPCAILTDSNVGLLHAAALERSLRDAGWPIVGTVEIPAGEASKGIETYADVVRRLARMGLTRDGALFALGGGVVGDLGGFVAATYMRGVGLVMLPTSLLAMVDSAVGGKTGLDLPEGKNLVGAFVRPLLVAADPGWLRTLPELEVSNGLAEVIKMGMLAGGRFFEDLGLIPAARAGDADALRALILHSVRFKAEVVAEDERESGRRAILNYGHTIGHALEAAADYALPHGSAVAAGMVAEETISRARFGTDLSGLHDDLLEAAGLPRSSPGVDAGAALRAMSRDKKRSATNDGTKNGGAGHRFVLLKDVGQPVYGVAVDDDQARRAIEAVVG
jgi:3-dehydroquinate synthase